MSRPAPLSRTALKDLVLLFAVPAGIAVVVMLVVYVPQLLAKPRYDFIYASCLEYSCSTIRVEGGKVIPRSSSQLSEGIDAVPDGAPIDLKYDYGRYGAVSQLYYYDVSERSTRALSDSEASRYELDTSSRSPDGYVLEREQSSGGFLFWGSNHSGWYLKDGLKKKEVDIHPSSSYYVGNIDFIGWVKQ